MICFRQIYSQINFFFLIWVYILWIGKLRKIQFWNRKPTFAVWCVTLTSLSWLNHFFSTAKSKADLLIHGTANCFIDDSIFFLNGEPCMHSCNELLMWVHSVPEEQAAAAAAAAVYSQRLSSSLCDRKSSSQETEPLEKVEICICAAFLICVC